MLYIRINFETRKIEYFKSLLDAKMLIVKSEPDSEPVKWSCYKDDEWRLCYADDKNYSKPLMAVVFIND